jgi:predicted permease
MRAAAVYRALLWCYPAQFRHEYGDQMASAFVAQLRDARRSDGGFAVAAIWTRALIDLVPTAISEHHHVIRQDLHHAVRVLLASPGFTAVAVLSLALGIGANTAIFSLLSSVVMHALPVRAPHELVILTNPNARGFGIGSQGGRRSLATYAEFLQLQAQATGFASVMASMSGTEDLEARVAGGEPERIRIRLVSGSYFPTLGVPAVAGRTFDARSEAAEGAAPYAVISHQYWQRRFGGQPDALGRTMTFRGGVVSIVGVMPASFFGETVGDQPDAWIPLAMQATVLPGRSWLHDQPGSVEKIMWLHVFGRLAPGVSVERAQASANLVFQQGLIPYYESIADAETRTRYRQQHLVATPAATGASSVRGAFAEPLWVMLGAAGIVLLIACSNLGNLLLARTTARVREITTRLALGASRGRLIRQLLTESLCLAIAGSVVGIGVAAVLRRGLLWLVADPTIVLPPAGDLRTIAFVVAMTLAVGLLLGLLPALRITKTHVAQGLREGRGIAGSLAWLRIGKVVVVVQLTLSVPLLVGAGLLVRTLFNLQQTDLGYPRDGLATVRVDGETAGYGPARQAAAFNDMLARIRELPSVRAATYSNNGLFDNTDNGDRISVEGYTPTGRGDGGSSYDAVGPAYFSTLGIPVVLGREISEQDLAAGRMVAVINERFAARFFADRNPLGLHITQMYADERRTYEIIGVVRNSRHNRLRGEIEHRFYTPITQPAAKVAAVTFLIRPRGDDAPVLANVRTALQRTEPNMPITDARTLNTAVNARVVQDRLLAQLSAAFGILAALLTAIGLYGVLSYGIARRTNEIAVRKALGAQHGTLMCMIARETASLLLVGMIAGAALSIAIIRLIAARLYGLSPGDPVTFVGALTGLTLVAALATWLPAYRASRVDALVALRYD